MLSILDNADLPRGVNWSLLSDPLYAALDDLTQTQRLRAKPGGLSALTDNARLLAPARRAGAMFAMHGNWRPEWPLLALEMAASPAVKAAWFVDPWPHTLDRVAQAVRWLRLDLAFIPYREAYEALRKGPLGERFVYLPYATDTATFQNTGQVRDIDILWMGRKDEALHRALLALSERHGLTYLYREKTGFLDDPRDLGALAARARYFVVTPPPPERSGGYSPLVMRYLEGLSAGCRLLGTLPRSGEFEAILPREAVLEVQPDGSDLETRFLADQDNPPGWAASQHASTTVRAQHGWDARARTIWQHISDALARA